MVMMPIVQLPIACATAEEFIEALSPIGNYFKAVKPLGEWLFRGQGADLPLVPSAFRQRGTEKLTQLSGRQIDNYGQRMLAERDALIRFFEIADRRGLVLPDDSQELRSTLEILNSERGDLFVERGYQEWQPADKALSIMALAQHYGLPTRLLDWTKRSWIAAFFAADSAYHNRTRNQPSDVMVVWAFYFPFIGKHDSLGRHTDPIRVVTAPTATNPNLRAQQGVFTLLSPYYTNEAEGPYQPMEQVLEEMAATGDPEKSSAAKSIEGSKLQKFTLPTSEAKHLLLLLAKLDITPSAIYPGYQSILSDLEILSS